MRNHWKHKFYAIRRFQPGRWEGGLIGITSRSLEIHEKLSSWSVRPKALSRRRRRLSKGRTERVWPTSPLALARGIKLNMGKESRYENTQAPSKIFTPKCLEGCPQLHRHCRLVIFPNFFDRRLRLYAYAVVCMIQIWIKSPYLSHLSVRS